jgi:regulation of enolase protein 1 (concanavalin A-like superfamily)
VTASAAAGDLGAFEAQADVGKVDPPGSAEFDKDAGQYRIKSAGQNIWGVHDDFHFVYRKSSGDLVATAEVSWKGEGKNAHRKAGCMIRQSLEPDAAYADVMVHGDGLISLQYREKAGGPTKEIKSTVKAPAAVRLERRGDTVTASVATSAEQAGKGDKTDPKEKQLSFRPIGSVQLPLKDPAYAGLAACSHDATVEETAIFSRVTIKSEPAPSKREK